MKTFGSLSSQDSCKFHQSEIPSPESWQVELVSEVILLTLSLFNKIARNKLS